MANRATLELPDLPPVCEPLKAVYRWQLCLISGRMPGEASSMILPLLYGIDVIQHRPYSIMT